MTITRVLLTLTLTWLWCLTDIGLSFGQQPTVYRDRVAPNWIGMDGRFWYRVTMGARKAEFVYVDPADGSRTPAIDHESVADQLSEKLSQKFDANNLPFSKLEYSKDGRQIVLAGRVGRWTLDVASQKLSRLEEVAKPSSSWFLPPRRSRDKGGDVYFAFRNSLAANVDLLWMERSSGMTKYHTVGPGKTIEQHTFDGHVWVVQIDDKVLAAFEVTESDHKFDLTQQGIDDLAKRTARPSPRRRRKRPQSDSTSPDGSMSIKVNNHNLWMVKMPSGEGNVDIQLTTDATSENSFQKDASRSRLVEMQYTRPDPPADSPDVRWSPDGKHFVAFQTTKVMERRVHYIQSTPSKQTDPRLESYPYAKPGDPLPIARPRLFGNDAREISVSTQLMSNPFKLQFLKWSDDGSRFFLLYNERGHQALRVLAVSALDGSVNAVVNETSDTFIQYSSNGKFELEWLPGDQLLWASERTGWNHLYRYDVKTGQVVNAVTSGNWNVRRIERVDSDSGVIWFYAVGIVADQDPYHEHFCRVNLDGTELKVLTEGDGTHEVEFSPDRTFFLDRFSRVDMAAVTEYRSAEDGRLITELEVGDASEIVKSRGSLPIRFTAKGRDGETDIWGIIHLPRYFDPNEHYPIVENIYAGPHDHHVPKAFRTRYRHQHEIADTGTIVVQIDGMGTAWRSKKFHDVCYQNLRDAGFPDRILWIRAAAKKHPYMDTSRVGIYGGSAGGQNALGALLWHGTFYKAAVADCGCHDNRMDKLWWNEQWMGWPVDEHYISNSNTENAHLLQGHLMLVVGEMDRNVDPASTTQVVSKLIQARKDFEFLLMPGVGHGACERPYASRKRARFLAEHLAARDSSQDSEQ